MSTKTKSPAPPSGPGDALLTPAQRKSLLAQLHLLAAIKELTELRRTLRLRDLGMDEWREKFRKAGFPVATGWVETVQRLDRELASRLAKLRTTLKKANQLLTTPTDTRPEP